MVSVNPGGVELVPKVPGKIVRDSLVSSQGAEMTETVISPGLGSFGLGGVPVLGVLTGSRTRRSLDMMGQYVGNSINKCLTQ